MQTNYTDIVAQFNDRCAAETLASFISSVGVPCDLVDCLNSPVAGRFEPYAVRVNREQIAHLRDVLQLTPVVTRSKWDRAQIVAARLAREGVPCYIGGDHTYRSCFSLDSIRTLKETKETGDMIAVPARFFHQAMRLLNDGGFSEDELTKLALSSPPPDDM